MLRSKKITWLPLLMVATIAGIAAFQIYWLGKVYEREKRTLDIRSNMAFRETVHSLQVSKLKLDSLLVDSLQFSEIPLSSRHIGSRKRKKFDRMVPSQKMIGLVNVLNEKIKDSVVGGTVFFTEKPSGDSANGLRQSRRQRSRLLQFLYDVDSMQDSVTVREIAAAFSKRMDQQNISVPFAISRLQDAGEHPGFNEVTIGFSNPITYRMELHDPWWYLIKRIIAPILLSLFIVGFTTLSFWLVYRNLLRQRRLAEIKNEFISNITHELKTPIATVSVAIEALRSYNASMDPQKSREYLDISANELQRLSLLVDKVLKLSMFEKKEVELRYEWLNMQDLVAEVTASMRLQFEKHGAAVSVTAQGDTTLQGDRLHLVSVIFNLVDNALKYSTGSPKINVLVAGQAERVSLTVADNGIGIPAEFKNKVFEKFFRVPTGNLHNAKGYGLGLSYVAHVISKHQGTIQVESAEGSGSKFIINLPKQPA